MSNDPPSALLAQYTPQVVSNRRPFFFWLVGATASLVILSLTLVAPFAAAAEHRQLALTLYHGFSKLCHQLPERSFFIAGHQLAVCSRCTGLYAGFSLTFLFYPLVRSLRITTPPHAKWLLFASLPLAIDFGLTFFGLWENTHTSRLITGLLLGSVTVFYVVPGLADLGWRHLRKTTAENRAKFTVTSSEAIANAASDYSAPERRI